MADDIHFPFQPFPPLPNEGSVNAFGISCFGSDPSEACMKLHADIREAALCGLAYEVESGKSWWRRNISGCMVCCFAPKAGHENDCGFRGTPFWANMPTNPLNGRKSYELTFRAYRYINSLLPAFAEQLEWTSRDALAAIRADLASRPAREVLVTVTAPTPEDIAAERRAWALEPGDAGFEEARNAARSIWKSGKNVRYTTPSELARELAALAQVQLKSA